MTFTLRAAKPIFQFWKIGFEFAAIPLDRGIGCCLKPEGEPQKRVSQNFRFRIGNLRGSTPGIPAKTVVSGWAL